MSKEIEIEKSLFLCYNLNHQKYFNILYFLEKS